MGKAKAGIFMCRVLEKLRKAALQIPEAGISGGGNGNPLQYSCLGNAMDGMSITLLMCEMSAIVW